MTHMTMKRSLAVFAGLVLVAAACTNSVDPGPADSTLVESESVPPPAEKSLLLVDSTDGGIIVIDIDGTTIETIEPPSGARYSQPIWASPDTIVYAQVAVDDNRLEAIRLGADTLWSVGLATPPFYYLPAPGTDTATVLSLRNNPDQPGLLTEQITGQGVVEQVGDESPFYASWDPDGSGFASHIGDARLDVTDSSTDTISTSSSGYQAPVWLTGGLVGLRNQGGDTLLSLWTDASFTDVAKVRGAARFVAKGSSIAIITGGDIATGGIQASAQALPTITSGVLTVIDLEQGSFTSVTSDRSPFFQWDPAGERLLYVTFVDDPAPALVWHVWEDGEITDFEPFAPEPSWFGTVVPFFDQYAQSVSLWSRDGSAFAYPALVDGTPQIMLQNLTDQSPTSIIPGTWVAWSP